MRASDPPRLTADIRVRLARVLGMMGSDNDGEALNAARIADRLVRENGLTWVDVILAPAPRRTVDPANAPQPDTEDPLNRFDALEQCCRFILDHTPMLTAWERTFVLRLPGFTKLSPKQMNILRRLVARAFDAGGAP